MAVPFLLLITSDDSDQGVKIQWMESNKYGAFTTCKLYEQRVLEALLKNDNLRSVVITQFPYSKDLASGSVILDPFGLLLRDWVVDKGGKLVYIDNEQDPNAMKVLNESFFGGDAQWKHAEPVSGYYRLSRSGQDVLMVNDADNDNDNLVKYNFGRSTRNIKVKDYQDA